MKALTRTDFNFPGQKDVYHGKVRDVYNINDDLMVMIASDRISAFDVVLPKGIPFKGQVLKQIAASFLDATADILQNWKIAVAPIALMLVLFILIQGGIGILQYRMGVPRCTVPVHIAMSSVVVAFTSLFWAQGRVRDGGEAVVTGSPEGDAKRAVITAT